MHVSSNQTNRPYVTSHRSVRGERNLHYKAYTTGFPNRRTSKGRVISTSSSVSALTLPTVRPQKKVYAFCRSRIVKIKTFVRACYYVTREIQRWIRTRKKVTRQWYRWLYTWLLGRSHRFSFFAVCVARQTIHDITDACDSTYYTRCFTSTFILQSPIFSRDNCSFPYLFVAMYYILCPWSLYLFGRHSVDCCLVFTKQYPRIRSITIMRIR